MRFEWMGHVLVCTSLAMAAQAEPGTRFVRGNAGHPLGAADCSGGIVADDGTVEQGLTLVGTTSGVIVDRITPPSYPFRLERACVCWFQQNQAGDTSVAFDLAVFDDDGPGGGPGTFLGSVPVTATNVPGTLPGSFYGYDIRALDIVVASGSVFVGPRYNAAVEDTFLICADGSATTPLNSPATSLDGGLTFNLLNVPAFFRAMLIRAEGVPLPAPTVAVPALGELALAVLAAALAGAGLWWLRATARSR